MRNIKSQTNRLLVSGLLVLASFGSMSVYANDTDYNSGQDVNQSTQELSKFSTAELEQILAPIALYPDTVLSHILISATYPIEVIQAERWTSQNPDVKGSDAVQAVDAMDWDPSVKALVAFPEILKRLSENLEWTQKLGDAFLQDETNVLASVQSLRQRAYEAGSLDKMDKVTVTNEDNAISIAPVEKEVVYVPYYDTRVVYGSWYWPAYPPVYWAYPYGLTHYPAYYNSPFYWGPSIHISYGFHFSSFNWYGHHVVRIPHHYYNPHHYYSPHQIATHGNSQRWAHNPTHRRGVSYRSVTVSNRYSATNTSRRASQAEVRNYRNNVTAGTVNTRTTSNANIQQRSNSGVSTRSNTNRNNASQDRTTRIASPDRIRQELRDGRISLEERNTRPSNHSSNTRNNGTANRTLDSAPVNRSNRTTHNQTNGGQSDRGQQNREQIVNQNTGSQPTNNSYQTRSEPVRSEPTRSHSSSSRSSSSNSRPSSSRPPSNTNSSRSSSHSSSRSSGSRSSSHRSKGHNR